MDFWGTVLVLARRWYVTLVAFALAIGVSLTVYASIPVTYESAAVLVLTIPADAGAQAPKPGRPRELSNPFLKFETSLNMSASIVTAALETPEMATELGATPSGDPSYLVNNGNPNPESLTESPFLFIVGHSTSPAKAQAITARVMAKAKQVLADRQQALRAPTGTYITTDDVVLPTTPEPQHGRKTRAAAVTLALGLVASMTAAFAAESIAQARARGRVGPGAESNGQGGPRKRKRWARRRATPAPEPPERLAQDDPPLVGR